MTQEPPRPPPASSVQLAGQAVSAVVNGLKHQPALLAIIVLNLLAIAAAVWVLRGIADDARANRDHLLQLVEKCLTGRGDFSGPPAR